MQQVTSIQEVKSLSYASRMIELQSLQSLPAGVAGFGTAVNGAPHVIDLHVCPFSLNVNAKTNRFSEVTLSYNVMMRFHRHTHVK